MTRVLVLLAAHNGAGTIARQVATVLAQEDVEVIIEVGDDASSDATPSVLAGLQSRDGRIRVLTDRSRRGSASANFFALVAQADPTGFTHVAFSDQDDEWNPDKLARAVALLQKTRSAGYSAAVEARWPNGRRRVLTQRPVAKRADHLFEGAGQGCTFVFTVPLFRTLQQDVIDHASVLPALHYHDWALYALSHASGARWHFDAVPCMIYHQHPGNDTGARSSAAGIAGRIALIRQGWYRRQVDAVVTLLRCARPAHKPAFEWEVLSSRPANRFARLVYVLRHGRRRRTDRVIQAAAVIFGYL